MVRHSFFLAGTEFSMVRSASPLTWRRFLDFARMYTNRPQESTFGILGTDTEFEMKTYWRLHHRRLFHLRNAATYDDATSNASFSEFGVCPQI
jgi:hypothetical protein